ncbi:MAG: hypothetical protein IJC35_08435 [Oscillospiraceae bacterium]|nr:hypothetical protein [Oscillospiraceae bacterium]
MLKAKLQMKNGVPAIYVNGEWKEAQMLYLNTPSKPEGDRYELFLRQVKLAADSGVHMFTYHATLDTDMTSPPEETNKWLRKLMRDIIEIDPEALIMPRCSYNTNMDAVSTPLEDCVHFSDGRGMESERSTWEEYAADPTCLQREWMKRPFASFVSDYWRQQCVLMLTRFIRSCNADPILRDHIFCYHNATGMSSEHYQCRYWDGVLDVSESNNIGFRAWLRHKYGTEEALSSAWEMPMTFEAAAVPADLPGIRREYKPEIRELARRDRRVFDIMEWYTWRSWDAELDQPDAMNYSLRVWLDMCYKTDEALSRAWGGDYRLDGRNVPEDFRDWLIDFEYEPLLSGKGCRRFADYMEYYGNQVAKTIEEAAAAIKRETAGNALTCFFYGYHYDVQSAQSGHHSVDRVLQCPDVDILCSPLCYYNRNEGGMGAYMTDTTSIHNAGKLWLDESDYRQPVVTQTPSGLDVCMSIKSLEGAHQIALRQCGKLALYQAANWWMDLRGLGWYDSAELWSYIAEGRRYQMEMEAARKPGVAEVVFVNDETAMYRIGDAWKFADDLMNKTRNEVYYAGLSFDFVMLNDFLAGNADGAKVYVFLNPFNLIAAGKDKAVKDKLLENAAAAVWLYGFCENDCPKAVRSLTGFTLTRERQTADTLEIGGETYTRRAGKTVYIPRNGTVMGHYPSGDAAFAMTDEAGYRSYFLGGSRMYSNVLRDIAAENGALLHMDAGDMFYCIGNLAVLHTASAGEKKLTFRANKVRELVYGKEYGPTFTVNAEEFKTYLFILE